jgi:hypothetical protein
MRTWFGFKGLRYEREQVRDAVISAAKNIFCFDLPGVAILIPDFIREITNIVLIAYLCCSKHKREYVCVCV